MPITIRKLLKNPKSFSTLVGVAGTAIGIGIPFGIPLTIAICSLIYIYTNNPERYNKIIKQFPDTIGEIIEIIMKGEGGAKDKLKKILHTLKEDKESMQSIEKFSTADYENKEEIQELLCTETKNEAISLYSQLINFNQENLKVLLSEISGLKEKQKEILSEFDRRFGDLNKNLEMFKDEIIEDFRKTELYKEGFEIITSDYFSKYGPNKNCWDKGFRLIDVWHNYDARREITDDVEKALEEKDVLVLGKSGFGKTTFLYRIIVDFVKNGYAILYKEKDTTLEHPESVAEIIKNYSSDKNLLVVVDNVHLQNNINAFYIVDDLKRHEKRSKIKFFFTAKEPDFTDFLREDKEFWIKNPELKKIVKTIKKEMGNLNLDNLTLSEGELFVKKYFEVVKNKVVPDEVIKIDLPAHYKWSKEGDILLFTIYLTNEKRGIRQDIDYKFDRYVKDDPKKDFMLLTCLLESTNLEVKTEYLEGILKLSEDDYVDIVDDLLEYTLIYTKDRTKFWTRHQRWAIEYLKCIYYEKEKKSRRYRLSEKVENLTSALSDLKDEVLAYKFVVGLSKLIVYNKELRGLLLPSLKVPEFLSKDIKAELYTFDVREVYYCIHEYDEAINACTKAIELNPGLVAAYLSRGAVYADKKEFDRAIEDYNKGIDLKPNFALAYNGRGTVYLEKKEFDKAIEDFNREIELGSFFEAGAYRNRGIAYIDKGEFDRAIEDLNKAIELDSEYAKAYSSRGSAYTEKGDFDRAMKDYNKAIGLNPELTEAYNNRGLTYRKKGELNKAIQDYDTAIELEPDYGIASVAYSNRGVAYEEKGEFDRSIEDCNKAIELNPQDAKAYNNRGNAYADKKELDNAIEDFNKAIELNPELADAYNNRGLTYKNKGEFDKAIEDCNKAIELDPSFAEAYNNRGLVYKEKGDFDKAIEDYNRALELNPKDDKGTYYNNRGLAYEGKGELDKAIDDYNRALELNPKLVIAYNNRGVAYKEKGEFDTAIENYDKALELNPGYYNAYSNRGVAYDGKGDLDKAIENYDKAIELNPKLVDAYSNRGNAYSDKGEFDKAIEDFTKAIELRPDYAAAYYNRGNSYLKKGEFDKAIRDYNKAIELMPDLALAYHNRANAYFEKGDYDKAIQDFTKVIELKPDSVKAYSGRGNAHACKNELDKAIEDYNKAIELKPDYVDGLYSIRGVIYGLKGDIGKAVEDYKKAKELTGVDVYGSNEMFEKAIQDMRSLGFGSEYFIKTQGAIFTELDDEAMEHYKRGHTYWIKQEFDKAIDEFERVIELKPNFGMAYLIQGQIYFKKGVFDKAIDDYNNAIELNPNDATAYHDRGRAYREKGEYDKAVEDFNKAIDLNPKIAWAAYVNMGLVYLKKEEFDKAIEYFTKAIEIKTDYAEVYYNRGETYAKRNDFINCANDFFISAFLLFMQKRGNEALKLIKATYDLKDRIDSPVCFECGAVLVAFAEVIGFDPKYAEEHAKRIEDIQKHREEISKSARIVLDYLISGEVQEEIEVKDGRDAVFKLLLEGLQNRDKTG